MDTAEPTAVALDDATVAFRLADARVYTAVEQASLSVAHGEFVAIVGPTGCGKSTLLNVAAGLLKPAAGTVQIFDAAADRAQPGRRLSVPGRCAVSLEDRDRQCRDRPRDRRRAARARRWSARRAGSPRSVSAAFADRYPHMLSGGQRKRVGLAQVLIRDPKILLMDEPFGPLDAQTRQIMGNLLLELWNADRKAVLFVTHDLEEAIALADRVVIMSAGPGARIIGDWRVPLPRPRDISEVRLDKEFHELHREIWSVLKDEVMKGYAQSTLSGGGRLMSRRDTAVAAVAGRGGGARAVAVPRHRAGVRPHPAAAVLLLQSGRCRQPDRQMVRERRDLEASRDHAVGVDPRLRDRLARRRAGRLLVRAPAARCRGVRSLCQDGQRAAARRAGADLHAVARPRHLVQGRARRDAGVLHRVLQRLSGRQGSQPAPCSTTAACSA